MLRTSIIRFVSSALGRRSIFSTCPTSRYDHRAIADGHKATQHRRKPARGGQNLSDRYIRLENSLRGKEVFSKELEGLTHSTSSVRYGLKKPVEVFHGFEVPEEPKAPADDECCMSGCAVCVYDLYEESLEAYQDALSTLRTSLSALNIPEYEWPLSIQPNLNSTQSQSGKRKDTVLSAFEEMEQALSLKKQAEEGGVQQNAILAIAQLKNAKRHQLADKMKDASHNTFLHELYHGLRWVLFSDR